MEYKELISAFRRPFSKGKMTPFFRLVTTPGSCFKLKNTLVPVVSFSIIAIDSLPAYANNPPGSIGEVLFAYMIPVAMIMMTLLSGGYAILNRLKAAKGKPTVLIAHTVKGKGVSFMENNPKFHGVAPTPAEVEQALKELA